MQVRYLAYSTKSEFSPRFMTDESMSYYDKGLAHTKILWRQRILDDNVLKKMLGGKGSAGRGFKLLQDTSQNWLVAQEPGKKRQRR